ncbi:CubicO group peptidase (beta-lactamase class C family) [Clostridiales Family XIII bacterium PM5-7]
MVNREKLEKRLDAVISPVMHEGTPGMALLIAKGDEVLIRKAYGLADLEHQTPVKVEDNFIIASNTKQFTCYAIAMLKEQGLLDYDEPIERFFPDFPEYRKFVTIRQMMTHQSGIKEYFEENRWMEQEGIETADTKKMLEMIKSFGELDFEPETQFSYCNSSYVMLGDIVRQLSGIPFGRFIEERIIRPTGMKNTFAPDGMNNKPNNLIEGYLVQEDGGFKKLPYDMNMVGYADGNIQSNVDDLFRWLKHLHMEEQEIFLKREVMKQAFTETRLKDGEGTGYGLGFFIDGNGRKEIWHTGGTMGFVSRCSWYPDEQVSIIMLTNYEGLPKNELYEKIVKEVFV